MRLDHDPDIGEAALKRLIYGRLKHLELHLGGLCLMVVDDPVAAGERVNQDGSKRWARGGAAGQSDLRLIVARRAFSIEVKTRTGKQKKKQRIYEQRVVDAGGVYYVARNLRQALEPVYQALGIPLE